MPEVNLFARSEVNMAANGAATVEDNSGMGAGAGVGTPSARGEFNDYFSELTNIELSKDMETQTDDEPPPKTPDGEQPS